MGKQEKKRLQRGRNRAPRVAQGADAAHLAGDASRPNRSRIERSDAARHYAVPAVCGLLLLAVALVFGQTVRHKFVNYDDDEYVYANSQISHGFSGQGIGWAFTHFHSNNWHPLTWLSHTLDCQAYGLEHPGGHHLTNILLHAASAVLLFLVLRQMTGDLWPSGFVAALFAIHPLHVESVAWVAERKDVLSGLLFMLTLAAYTGYARRPFSLLRYLLVTALFTLGLMAKPMLVTLPFVLLLLDYWPLGRGARSRRGMRLLVVEKLPWLALAAVACVVTFAAQGSAVLPFQSVPLPERIANALVSCVAYLGQLFYPVGLVAYYPHWQTQAQYALPGGKTLGSLALLAGISLAVVACRRKCPYLTVGWLWYLGMLVPVMGIVQAGSQAMADRYTYLTQIGLYMALAWGGKQVSARRPALRSWAAAAAAIAIAAGTGFAWRQASTWRDSETLWKHCLTRSWENGLAHGNLGNALAAQGKLDEAIQHYLVVLSMKPRDDLAHVQLGLARARQGRLRDAEGSFREALRWNPANADACCYLAKALQELGRTEEALQGYKDTLRLQPDRLEALSNMAWILATNPDAKFRDGPEAVRLACRARELSADETAALNTLAAAYAAAGRFAEAVQTARMGMDLAARQGQPARVEFLRAAMRRYEAGRPLRESPSAPAKTSN